MKKVLVVDNSSYMRMFVKKVIQKEEGYRVFQAASKHEAIALFKIEKPGIVILDLNMAENTMEGVEVLTEVMKMNSETNVIIVSAVRDENVKNECIALGAKSYIEKPIDVEALLKAL